MEEWGFKDLTASEKESLLNALDLIEMNAEMFNRLAKGLGSRGRHVGLPQRHVGLPLVDKSPNQPQLKVPVSKGVPR